MTESNESSGILSDFLAGFEFVESDGSPFITLDNQRRFYLNSSARRLLGVKPYDRLSIAYNIEDKSVAIVKHGVLPLDGILATSNYVVDKRYYLSARHFSRTYRYEPKDAPYYFDYVRGSAGGSAFVFKLRD